MSRPALHVWDLADPRTLACGLALGRRVVSAVMSSRHLPDVRRMNRTAQRICRNCKRVVAARVARRGGKP